METYTFKCSYLDDLYISTVAKDEEDALYKVANRLNDVTAVRLLKSDFKLVKGK